VSKVQSSELLEVVEEALVEHPVFGDSDYIVERFEASSKRRLGAIATQLPSAAHLLEALEEAGDESVYRVTGNTVIRCAIQHAHTQVETDEAYGLPLANCSAIFDATASHLEEGKWGTPFETGSGWLPQLGDEPYHGWVWREDYPETLFGRSYRLLIRQNYGDPLCTPSEEELAALRRGEELLRTLLPLLTPSALRHAHLVGVFPHAGAWKDKASSSQIRIGGSVFLARSLMRSPWIVAEHLFHEALHQKLYDFRHGHTLLEPEFSNRGAPRVRSVWNPAQLNDANNWDTHRVFAAFHVYVHLALLAQVAAARADELEDEYGPRDGLIDGAKAFARAWYLGEQLRGEPWRVLGLAGQRLVDWLMSVLEALEPAPPPEGAYLHLVLDLYQREARKVGWALRSSEPSSARLGDLLGPLAEREVETTRQLLTDLEADPQLAELRQGLDAVPGGTSPAAFVDVRSLVARILLSAAPDGYALPPTPHDDADPNERVLEMVLRGSETLYLAMENLPEPVAAAKRRAHLRRITVGCLDEVGRMLAVLAAAVPSGGRILEVGTSVGVGTAWITSGLGGRSDVELITVEIDPKLVEAAREWAWPPNVQVLHRDATDALRTLGLFELIFLDASPVKHGPIASAIAALQPGGLVVIDDLHNDLKDYERQKAAKDELRRYIFSHPELQSVELDWASGVIIASRSAA
jgi:predicted O-methyltransferase YrrM